MKKFFTFLLMAFGFMSFAQSPTTSATTPSQSASDVISVFSDSYTDVGGTNFYPSWGQTTTFADFNIGTDTMIQYGSLNYQGMEFSPALNVSAKGSFHIDIWTNDVTEIEIYFINPGPLERKVVKTLTTGQWNSFDIDLTDYSGQGVSLANVYQFKFVATGGSGGTVFLDNIYFYGSPSATRPTAAAPTPMQEDTNVISIYSGVYNNIAADVYPNWGQSTTFLEDTVAGDSMLKYGNLNYQGIIPGASIDASNMGFLHMDVWSADLDSFYLLMINPGPVEHKVVPTLNTAEWTSIDIPLSDFSSQGIDLSDIFQMKLDVQPYGNGGTLFIDNMYFYKVPPIPTPMMAASDPTHAESLVISLFSGVYTDVTVDTWRTSWSEGDLTEEQVAGNDVKKYSNVNFVGIETTGDNSIDASGMKYFNFDMWTPNQTQFRVKLVDWGADNAFGGGDDTEHELTYEMPATSTWNNFKIELDSFVGLASREHLSQLILAGAPSTGIFYLDNVYYSKDSTGNVNDLALASVNVYPNPTAGTLNVNINSGSNVIKNMQIMNVQGQELFSKTVNNTVINERLDLSGYSKGVYFLSLTSEAGKYTQKVIVQ